MARFQATTTALLDKELDALREEMGLRENQKAELLRELASMAAWLVAQARAGRTIEARGPSGVEVFVHPALRSASSVERLVLAPDEVQRLGALLASDAPLSDTLRATLARLADEDRQPPHLGWPAR
ncbi:MAG: hypothetical protein GXP62_03790 [Oligoflexia bacterium]|nr:hypothetical protein [Oligoflexia bacterium]